MKFLLINAVCALWQTVAVRAAQNDMIQENRPVRRLGSGSYPDVLDLPVGFRPEGIVSGDGSTVYVSCTRGDRAGSIWKGDVVTGQGEVIVGPTGVATRGLAIDSKTRLWVAELLGARVYDVDSGELLKVYEFSKEATINDVIVTENAVIFTDSGASENPDRQGSPRLFIVPLEEDSSSSEDTMVSDLPDEDDVIELPVQREDSGDLDVKFPNLNGIETVPGDSSKVLVCHSRLATLFQVDLNTGNAVEVDVTVPNSIGLPEPNCAPDGGFGSEYPLRPFTCCDGLLRDNNKVYVVRNRSTAVSTIEISQDGSSAELTDVYDLKKNKYIGDAIDTPTTGALFDNNLYVPDAQFRDPVATDFKVYRLELN